MRDRNHSAISLSSAIGKHFNTASKAHLYFFQKYLSLHTHLHEEKNSKMNIFLTGSPVIPDFFNTYLLIFCFLDMYFRSSIKVSFPWGWEPILKRSICITEMAVPPKASPRTQINQKRRSLCPKLRLNTYHS